MIIEELRTPIFGEKENISKALIHEAIAKVT
jgi:hypothetical protein